MLFLSVALAIPSVEFLALRLSRDAGIETLDHAGFVEHLEHRIPAWMANHDVPGVAVSLVDGGQPSWSGAFGHADRESARPLTTATRMMAHSISKSVTAWGVMKLVEQGQIALDDPVERHLRSWRFPPSGFPASEVTIRKLLSHDAGVPLGPLGVHYAPGAPVPPLARTLSGDGARLIRMPGTAFDYSNSGFAVLELLVEDVTGRDYGEWMEQNVLVPLDMHASGYAWREADGSDVPTGYDLDGHPVPPYRYANRASGGMFASVADIGRFVAAGMLLPGIDRPVLSTAGLAALYEPAVAVSGLFDVVADAYGLGHFLEFLPSGTLSVWHGGQGLGWMTHFHSVPERGHGIVVLTNSQRSWPLIARVLEDWSRWKRLGSIGMTRMIVAQAAARTIVGWMLLVSAAYAWRIARGVRSGERRIAVRGGHAAIRGLELVASITLLGVLLWSSAQDYLFVSSVLPDESAWLGGAAGALAIALLASAATPNRRT